MSDRPFSHPNFGKQVRIEAFGTEVHLIFVAGTPEQADSLIETLLAQLKAGALNLTLMGTPTSIQDDSATGGRDEQ